jgi:RNA polymerase sigma-70 factor (ECF subfamily)
MNRIDFNDLVRNISRKLYGYAYRILRDQTAAEDTVQEVFIRLWKMNAKLDEYKSVEALALTMTKNYCIDQLRKNKQYESGNNPDTSFLKTQEPTPHEEMEKNEIASILNKIIERLPETYRELIKLRDIEGLSYEEIADIKGENINKLRVNISRARKLIRDQYLKYTYEFRGY